MYWKEPENAVILFTIKSPLEVILPEAVILPIILASFAIIVWLELILLEAVKWPLKLISLGNATVSPENGFIWLVNILEVKRPWPAVTIPPLELIFPEAVTCVVSTFEIVVGVKVSTVNDSPIIAPLALIPPEAVISPWNILNISVPPLCVTIKLEASSLSLESTFTIILPGASNIPSPLVPFLNAKWFVT